MKRREFLKATAVAGSALTLTFNGLQSTLANNNTNPNTTPDLVAIMGGEPDAMFAQAMEALGGMERYIKKGQSVVVKPNIGWDRTPDLAANTNPILVKAVIKACFKAGASKVSVFDHTCDNWQNCYTNSGMAAAVKEAGGTLIPGNDEIYYKPVALPKGLVLKNTKIHTALLEADVWINIPVLKNHGGAKMSISMKNYMGIIWDRKFFHANDLPQCIADVCTWEKKPVLNIVDAYRIMRQNGPQGKDANDVSLLKTLIVSSDIVAADTAAIKFFNQVEPMDIAAVGYIGKGEAHNLGTTKLDTLNIKKIKL